MGRTPGLIVYLFSGQSSGVGCIDTDTKTPFKFDVSYGTPLLSCWLACDVVVVMLCVSTLTLPITSAELQEVTQVPITIKN